MADAMVVARMSPTKKEATARILDELGSNASQAINEFYDYLLAEKRFPWQEDNNQSMQTPTKAELASAIEWVDGLGVALPTKYASLSVKDARRKRLGIS